MNADKNSPAPEDAPDEKDATAEAADAAQQKSPPAGSRAAASSGRGSSGGGAGGSGGSGQSAGIDKLVEDLLVAQRELLQNLDQGKAAVAQFEARQQDLKRQLGELERAAQGLDRGSTDAEAALKDAESGLAAAEPLLDTLEDQVKDDLREQLEAIDAEIEQARTSVTTDSEGLAEKQAQADTRKQEVRDRQSAYDEALARLTDLPKVLKSRVDALKKLVAELAAACTAGQPLKAFVLAQEVETHRSELENAASAGYESELVSKLTEAQSALGTARDQLATATTELDGQQKTYEESAAALKKLIGDRATKLKDLWAPPPETEPAKGA